MAQGNADRIRRLVEAYNTLDLETVEEILHPDLVWYPDVTQPETGPRRGRDAYLRYGEDWLESFDHYVVEVVELVEVGDCVATRGRVRGSGRTSGVAVDSESAWVWRLRDGVAVEYRECRTLEEALELARLPSFEPPV
jgi:ketosteroid isomerase-like protein